MNVLSSRRLWTFIVAQMVTIATFVFSHYVSVDTELVGLVIGFVQGLAAILITAYTVDDINNQNQSAK